MADRGSAGGGRGGRGGFGRGGRGGRRGRRGRGRGKAEEKEVSGRNALYTPTRRNVCVCMYVYPYTILQDINNKYV